MSDKCRAQQEEALACLALQGPAGEQDSGDGERDFERAVSGWGVNGRHAKPRAADGGERQRHPLRESELADQSLGLGRVEAAESPYKHRERRAGQRGNRDQRADGLRHESNYTCPAMRAVDVIRRKRDGGELGDDEIRAFVAGATDGSWPDYQISALLMAIVWRGLSLDETVVLTNAMVRSGERLDLSEFGGVPVDKHSTGGVGDKLSLVIAPLVAACGGLVPMMSGRGLGHTGGTLDKLESIPGFRTSLTLPEMRAALRKTRCVLIGQTAEIAPADRRLYSLRDVTGTVESIPLICGSILSKKIAEGIGGLVMDVKVGAGAFMKTADDARRLAAWLVEIAERNGVRTEAILTTMDTPLGRAVGNANEVIESFETLKGKGPKDIEELSLLFAARMLILAGLETTENAAVSRVRAALTSGKGVEAFAAIIEQQGGDPKVLDDYSRMPKASAKDQLTATTDGTVIAMQAELVGRAAVALGAGRDRADAGVDSAAGIDILAPVGATVRRGDPVFALSCSDAARLPAAKALLTQALQIGERAAASSSVSPVIDRITGRGAATPN